MLESTDWVVPSGLGGWVGTTHVPRLITIPVISKHPQSSPPSPHLSPPLNHLPTLGLSDQWSQTISEMGFSLHEQAAPAKFLHC